MSIVAKAARQARIIAIPLTRPREPTRPAESGRMLTYYQFQTANDDTPRRPGPGNRSSRWFPEGGISKWIQTKAAVTWSGLGKAQGGWKLKLFTLGESFLDRIDFEELALKHIDPTLGPKIIDEVPEEKTRQFNIPLLYPSSISTGSAFLNDFRAMVASRVPQHRRGFLLWMLIAPFTAPFILIPIIPNIPFFFCVWRSWSHYKAYRASQHLASLLEAGYISPKSSEPLDAIYRDTDPDKTESPADQHHGVLLTRAAVPRLITLFGSKQIFETDMLRAIEQAKVRIKKGRRDP